ncbi:CHAP domain-containing protein [Desertivirga xinjiangensis]|uniref:CHAP domain-containing protein n=1 Tax=Desertivirga xinjiangensis TaxID=539206 RepID=UPI00210EE3A4|nr:CHAP domain-containing protein [Pedobacter xinjiangensis]
MLESKYLFKFLFAGVILFCIDAFSAGVENPGTEVWERFSLVRTDPVADSRETLRKIYTAEIGVREKTGRNDGARVEEYLKYVDLSKGEPYCAAFASWCMGKAGIPNPRTGWSPSLFPADKVVWERSRSLSASPGPAGLTGPKYTPQSGDVFGIYFPEKKRIAHVGFIEKWDDSWIITVEANTNSAGSREGDGVYRKRRLTASIYKVSSFITTKSQHL